MALTWFNRTWSDEATPIAAQYEESKAWSSPSLQGGNARQRAPIESLECDEVKCVAVFLARIPFEYQLDQVPDFGSI
jgi:hypothetical protein